jgi:hypothetical protein
VDQRDSGGIVRQPNIIPRLTAANQALHVLPPRIVEDPTAQKLAKEVAHELAMRDEAAVHCVLHQLGDRMPGDPALDAS